MVWTPDAQAELIKQALTRLDVSNAIVLWTLMGRIGCRGAGAEIPRSNPRTGPRLRVLLSDRKARCHRDGGACFATHRRHPQSYLVAADQPRDLAADDVENLWPPIHAQEVRSISEGNGSSPLPDRASAADRR